MGLAATELNCGKRPAVTRGRHTFLLDIEIAISAPRDGFIKGVDPATQTLDIYSF